MIVQKILLEKLKCFNGWKICRFDWLCRLWLRISTRRLFWTSEYVLERNYFRKTPQKHVKILNWRLFPYRFGEIFEEVWVPRLLTELLDRRHPHVARNCKKTPQFVCDTLVQCIKHKTVGFAFRFTLNWTNITLI